ncbi:MAG: hypothetical protein ACRDLU_03365 [Gaiellaceae bacterium]
MLLTALAVGLLAVPSSIAGHATDGMDVEVTNDNNNAVGGTPNPGFDAQNRNRPRRRSPSAPSTRTSWRQGPMTTGW